MLMEACIASNATDTTNGAAAHAAYAANATMTSLSLSLFLPLLLLQPLAVCVFYDMVVWTSIHFRYMCYMRYRPIVRIRCMHIEFQ